MKYYLLRRLIIYFLVLFIGSFLVFSIIHLIPGDPLNLVVKPFASKEVRDATIQRLGLDKPIWEQYIIFLKNAFNGNFGISLKYNMDVTQVIGSRVVPTLLLSVSSFIISYILAIPLGILAAKHSRTWIDLTSMTVALAGICIPAFWLALMLIITFSVNLPWFPSTGYGGVSHFILPVICMSLEGTGMNARMMRSSMLEVLNQDYIVAARGKGVREVSVVFVHAFRNALLPMIALLGMRIGWLIGGDVIIEYVFAWPGLGRLLIDSILGRDYLVFQAMMLIIISFVIFGNLLADILYSIADPRITYK